MPLILVTNDDGYRSEGVKALAAALSGIRKQFGEGAIMAMGEGQQQPVDAISTGSLAVDLALGCGGLVPWCSDYPDDTTLRLFGTRVIPEFRS